MHVFVQVPIPKYIVLLSIDESGDQNNMIQDEEGEIKQSLERELNTISNDE